MRPSPCSSHPTGRRAAPALVALAAASLGAAGCGALTPRDDVALGQAVLEIGEVVNELRNQTGALQEQVDSLRLVAARQDSLIARLTAAQGAAPLR